MRANKFPTRTAVRHGDFGEIVTAALYRRVRRWCVPTMWSLAGYQANAATLAAAFTRDVRLMFARGEQQVIEAPTTAAPYRIAELTGAVLRRDLDEVARLGEQTAEELPALGQRLAEFGRRLRP